MAGTGAGAGDGTIASDGAEADAPDNVFMRSARRGLADDGGTLFGMLFFSKVSRPATDIEPKHFGRR